MSCVQPFFESINDCLCSLTDPFFIQLYIPSLYTSVNFQSFFQNAGVHVCGLVSCLLSLPPPTTPLWRILPVLFWRERWRSLIRSVRLALLSNASAMPSVADL